MRHTHGLNKERTDSVNHTDENPSKKGLKASTDKLVDLYQKFLEHKDYTKIPIIFPRLDVRQTYMKGISLNSYINSSERKCDINKTYIVDANTMLEPIGIAISDPSAATTSGYTYEDFNLPGEHRNPASCVNFIHLEGKQFATDSKWFVYAALMEYPIYVMLWDTVDTPNLNIDVDNLTFFKDEDLSVSMYPYDAKNSYPSGVTKFITRLGTRVYMDKSEVREGYVLYSWTMAQLPTKYL